MGIITEIKNSYWDIATSSEKQLSRRKFRLSERYEIIEEKIYDANDNYRYSFYAEYDKKSRVIKKTSPTGLVNTYLYDQWDNLIQKKEVGSCEKRYQYNAANRPISCEEITSTGKSKFSYTHYDHKGRLLSYTDTKNNKTEQTYDAFGRCLETKFPKEKDANGQIYHPIIQYDYDVLGNLTSHTTPQKEITKTKYNLYRKPIQIIYPDKTEIFLTYDKKGNLLQTLQQDQTRIEYTYDIFSRMTSKSIYTKENTLLSLEKWEYNAFNLISYTNAQGLVTYYFYDGANRKTLEKANKREKGYFYDALNFLERIQEKEIDFIQKHNEEGWILEQWEETAHRQENYMQFFYDSEGRKQKAHRRTSQGFAVDHFFYNEEGKINLHIDPLGAETKYLYTDYFDNSLQQTLLEKTTIDPTGNATIEFYSVANHLISTEKRNSANETIFFEELFYDRSGNQVKKASTVFLQNTPQKKIEIAWEYDNMGRKIKQIEAVNRISSFVYDKKGNLIEHTFPNNTKMKYSYDGLNRLIEEKSCDGSIHYHYNYTQDGSSLQIFDPVQNITILRKYNLFDEIIEEQFSTGPIYQWNYDKNGPLHIFYFT